MQPRKFLPRCVGQLDEPTIGIEEPGTFRAGFLPYTAKNKNSNLVLSLIFGVDTGSIKKSEFESVPLSHQNRG